MNTDHVDGVHYIFDRYAFINQILAYGKKGLRISEESGETFFDIGFLLSNTVKMAILPTAPRMVYE